MWVKHGKTIINHPWLGMVNIPPIKMMMTGGWFLAVFYPQLSHISTINKPNIYIHIHYPHLPTYYTYIIHITYILNICTLYNIYIYVYIYICIYMYIYIYTHWFISTINKPIYIYIWYNIYLYIHIFRQYCCYISHILSTYNPSIFHIISNI